MAALGGGVVPRQVVPRQVNARLPAKGPASFVFRLASFVFQVSGFGFRLSGFGFRVSSFRFRLSGFVFQVSGGSWGLGCRFQTPFIHRLRPRNLNDQGEEVPEHVVYAVRSMDHASGHIHAEAPSPSTTQPS